MLFYLRCVGTDMSEQADQLTAFTSAAPASDSSIILHVDCDCFYSGAKPSQ